MPSVTYGVSRETREGRGSHEGNSSWTGQGELGCEWPPHRGRASPPGVKILDQVTKVPAAWWAPSLLGIDKDVNEGTQCSRNYEGLPPGWGQKVGEICFITEVSAVRIRSASSGA